MALIHFRCEVEPGVKIAVEATKRHHLNANEPSGNHLLDELVDPREIEVVTGVPRLAYSAVSAAHIAIHRCRQQNPHRYGLSGGHRP